MITECYNKNIEKFTTLEEGCKCMPNFEEFNAKIPGGFEAFFERIHEDDNYFDTIQTFSVEEDPNFIEAFAD